MPRGLMVYGGLVVSPSMRMGRVMGQFYTSLVNGSIAVPVDGATFAIALPIASEPWTAAPRVYFSQGVVAWDFGDTPVGYRRAALVMYGGF